MLVISIDDLLSSSVSRVHHASGFGGTGGGKGNRRSRVQDTTPLYSWLLGHTRATTANELRRAFVTTADLHVASLCVLLINSITRLLVWLSASVSVCAGHGHFKIEGLIFAPPLLSLTLLTLLKGSQAKEEETSTSFEFDVDPLASSGRTQLLLLFSADLSSALYLQISVRSVRQSIACVAQFAGSSSPSIRTTEPRGPTVKALLRQRFTSPFSFKLMFTLTPKKRSKKIYVFNSVILFLCASSGCVYLQQQKEKKRKREEGEKEREKY